jgi:hypothetical protein
MTSLGIHQQLTDPREPTEQSTQEFNMPPQLYVFVMESI